MTSTRDLGLRAEDLAVSLLEQRGFRLLERNYRVKVGEIDVIALDGETLCFIEVRSRKSDRYGAARATITRDKRRRILEAAQTYLKTHRSQAHRRCRFDVVDITGSRAEILKDAFRVEDC